MHIQLVHSDVNWTIEYYEGVVRQVDLMDLIEDLLARCRISRRLFLRKQLVQC